ncbi:MAG: hypothetical protein MI919_08315 [Holophagales bacterium]|nr:hypothetical protein [Holophagales bacterium]
MNPGSQTRGRGGIPNTQARPRRFFFAAFELRVVREVEAGKSLGGR